MMNKFSQALPKLNLWNKLTEPASAIHGPDRRRNAQLLSALLLSLILLGTTSASVQLILIRNFLPTFVGIMTGVSVLVVAYIVSRTRFHYAGVVLGVSVPSIVVFNNVLVDSSDTIAFAYLLIGVLISNMFLPIIGAGILVIANTIIMSVLPLFSQSLEFSNLLGPMSFYVTTSILILLVHYHRNLLEIDRQEALKQAYDSTLQGWAHALELRDRETQGHSERVTTLTLKLAQKLGIRENELEYIHRGALLHDIGKMAIPDSILSKNEPLTEDEFHIIRQHPVDAKNMLDSISYLRPALDIPYCHHEKWNGEGYPQGLKGEDIPLAARIFAVVDVWDALGHDRPYRKAWPREKILSYIKEQSGQYFDPVCVDAFLELLEKEILSDDLSVETD